MKLDLIVVLIDLVVEDLSSNIDLVVEDLKILSLEELRISSLEDLEIILDLVTIRL